MGLPQVWGGLLHGFVSQCGLALFVARMPFSLRPGAVCWRGHSGLERFAVRTSFSVSPDTPRETHRHHPQKRTDTVSVSCRCARFCAPMWVSARLFPQLFSNPSRLGTKRTGGTCPVLSVLSGTHPRVTLPPQLQHHAARTAIGFHSL